MENFFRDLYQQVDIKLREISPERNAVRGYDMSAELVEESIFTLKEYLHRHPFPDKESETVYFKHWAPQFFKLHVLYTTLYNMERVRITAADADTFDRCITKKLRRIRRFLKRHKDLREYYHLDKSDRDGELFVETMPSKTEDFLTADKHYCRNSILLAKIMAFEELVPILSKEVMQGESRLGSPEPGSRTGKKNYTLNLSKAQAAELVYSFVKMKCISVDGHFADIKDVAEFLKDTLGYDIPNIYDVELHNKRRKKERAPFLKDLLDSYLQSEE